MLVKGIFDQKIEQLESPHYKYMYYDFITEINESGLEPGYKKSRILPLLLADYKNLRDEYQVYDAQYKPGFVYRSWKESYFLLRYRFNTLIGLMNFYYSEETEELLEEALHFKYPRITPVPSLSV